MEKNTSAMKIAAIVICAVLMIVVLYSWVVVPPGYCGVKRFLGALYEEPLPSGFHWKVPLLDSVEIMDLRVQRIDAQMSASTKDLQEVSATIIVNYRVDPEEAVELYRTVGMDYPEVILMPNGAEIYKAESAKHTAEDLIVRRSDVSTGILESLKTKLTSYGILVESVSIAEFNFSEEFNRAIEAKVTAEQKALQAEKELEQTKFEAQKKEESAKGEAAAVLAKAQAEAEAMELKTKVLDEKLLLLEAVNKWDGRLPQFIMGEGIVPLLPSRDLLVPTKPESATAPPSPSSMTN
ncbi:MAG: prohibitin family protein [Planctomycetia bacterium]|nr:prohibitin family protein [Planctomycetia bacterium]